MADPVTVKSTDGRSITYDRQAEAGTGLRKDVFFTLDRTEVVAWFRGPLDYNSLDRLKNIIGPYRSDILQREGGDYLSELYRWPSGIIQEGSRVGIVVPAYKPEFFFKYGSTNNDILGIRNREKEGKWFASASHQSRYLDPRERGDWRSYIGVCLKIARGVRRLHSAGLAHSDLSYKNVLVDPVSVSACLIDLDGLVVPGKWPPDVVGSPDFIAPEVMASAHLDLRDPGRSLPRRETDQHALAVLIYMYLLYRHPLRGKKVHDTDDPKACEDLAMGRGALFVEHPTDFTNRPDLRDVGKFSLPFADVARVPYTVTGPYLAPLFRRAFVDALHSPIHRPSADEWEQALVRTTDLLRPCENSGCAQKWFVQEAPGRCKCPFCGAAQSKALPLLQFYQQAGAGNFRSEKHSLVVHPEQSLYPWHALRSVVPNERLSAQKRSRVGYFAEKGGAWYLVNMTLATALDAKRRQPIPPGTSIKLENDQQIVLDSSPQGRLVSVHLV